jgi:hypothetical protein
VEQPDLVALFCTALVAPTPSEITLCMIYGADGVCTRESRAAKYLMALALYELINYCLSHFFHQGGGGAWEIRRRPEISMLCDVRRKINSAEAVCSFLSVLNRATDF